MSSKSIHANTAPDEYIFGDQDCKIDGDRTTKSEFDFRLVSKWDEAMQAGLFRYDLKHIKTKPIEGPHGYIALLNEKRANERRPPDAMQSVNQPFDSNKFNFNKVKVEEILFTIKHRDQYPPTNNKIIINVSPVDAAHSLIVPDIDKNLNQNLTFNGIKLSLEVMCLSSSSSFKIGFNSLCAHASVNHQHLHCYYTDRELLADRVQGIPLAKGLYKLDVDAPHGFGFELTDVKDIASTSRLIFNCVTEMRCGEIAHCMFMCRGPSFSDPHAPAVRVLLWPRTKLIGAKPAAAAFNTAVLEMAGHLLIKAETYYDQITDESALSCFKEIMLPNNEFEELTRQLVAISTFGNHDLSTGQ